MRNWTDDSLNTPCRSETDWKDVQDVCQHLSIPCERVYFPLQRDSSVLIGRLI
jgi:tRNA U34 2-thiouridine synthase MnmA/TrmU